jgi:hypothetical protein
MVKIKYILTVLFLYTTCSYGHLLESNFDTEIAYLIPQKLEIPVIDKLDISGMNKEIKVSLSKKSKLFFRFNNKFKILRNREKSDLFKEFVVNSEEKVHIADIDGIGIAIYYNDDYQKCKVCESYFYDDDSLGMLLSTTPEVFKKIAVDEVVPYISMLYKKLNILEINTFRLVEVEINKRNYFIAEEKKGEDDLIGSLEFFTHVIFSLNGKIVKISFKNVSLEDEHFLKILKGITVVDINNNK